MRLPENPFAITTPALILDRKCLQANARRMARHIGGLGGTLRPHVKTHKSMDVLRVIEAAGAMSGITVSTLREASHFYAQGVSDILYAVGLSPNKLSSALDLIARGCELTVILDSVPVALALGAAAADRGLVVPALIELDVDGHRAGVDPRGAVLFDVARTLQAAEGTELRGVMTHAGSSYGCREGGALQSIAQRERDLSVEAAQRLRAAGLPCPVVSIGSTPTALAIDDLSGITEVRAGVYAFFDLVMANVGVCSLDEIALSVLVTVTGHQRERGLVITDGGWMALSRDRGTASQAVDYAYGVVCDADGAPIEGLLMSGANQEHGILSRGDGRAVDFDAFPIGRPLRILPNHACATAAQHGRYHVLSDGQVSGTWERISGW